MPLELKSRVPAGPLPEQWDRHRFEMKLVNPANKRKHTIIVVGSGLAGAAAAAPARPDPTTMIVCFRLFAGLTSFISNRCRSHFSGSGPAGMRELSSSGIYRITPRNIATGMAVKPSHTTSAITVATCRCSGRGDGLARPRVRTDDHAPWKRCSMRNSITTT